ncbi:MAG: hypothetical protein KGY50_05525 [Candidatus Thermoplasmatota archaeon]|nr:hypothetical protein [Candidatus Thermoplasmatota archaeon]
MKHKKIIIFALFSCFLFASSVSSTVNTTNSTTTHFLNQNQAVFIEYATATWCPECPIASQTLYDLQSNHSSFYYVTLVVDTNQAGNQRSSDYTNYAIPSVYFDGGYRQYIGGGESLSSEYTSLIEETLQRPNRKNIQITGDVIVLNDNKLMLSIDLTNEDKRPYFGTIRTYITEKESRWNDFDENPYHYGLLDFAIDQPIQIKKEETVTIETQWDPTDTSTGESFSDVSTNNLQIFTTVSHWIPHFRTGYFQFPYLQLYFAYYTDQVLSLEP